MTLKLQCFEHFTIMNYIFGWDRNNTYFSLSSLTLPLQNNVVTKLQRIFTNTHTWYHYKTSGRGEHLKKKNPSDSKCFDLIFFNTVQEFFNSITLMWPILARTLVRNILIKANLDYLWTYMYFFSKNYNMSIYTYITFFHISNMVPCNCE